MTKEEFINKFGDVEMRFHRFDNYAAYFKATLLDGTRLEKILSSGDIAAYKFDVLLTQKLSEPSPHNVMYSYTPKSNGFHSPYSETQYFEE